jgi:hypothetical protein
MAGTPLMPTLAGSVSGSLSLFMRINFMPIHDKRDALIDN